METELILSRICESITHCDVGDIEQAGMYADLETEVIHDLLMLRTSLREGRKSDSVGILALMRERCRDDAYVVSIHTLSKSLRAKVLTVKRPGRSLKNRTDERLEISDSSDVTMLAGWKSEFSDNAMSESVKKEHPTGSINDNADAISKYELYFIEQKAELLEGLSDKRDIYKDADSALSPSHFDIDCTGVVHSNSLQGEKNICVDGKNQTSPDKAATPPQRKQEKLSLRKRTPMHELSSCGGSAVQPDNTNAINASHQTSHDNVSDAHQLAKALSDTSIAELRFINTTKEMPSNGRCVLSLKKKTGGANLLSNGLVHRPQGEEEAAPHSQPVSTLFAVRLKPRAYVSGDFDSDTVDNSQMPPDCACAPLLGCIDAVEDAGDEDCFVVLDHNVEADEFGEDRVDEPSLEIMSDVEDDWIYNDDALDSKVLDVEPFGFGYDICPAFLDELYDSTSESDDNGYDCSLISKEDRAFQKAVQFVSMAGWPSSVLSLVEQIFLQSGTGATRIALERELEKGMTPRELALAAHLKVVWANNDYYWISYLRNGSSQLSYSVMTWPMALQIVRSFDWLPQIEELEIFLESVYEYWYDRYQLRRAFRSFSKFLWFRISNLSSALPANHPYSFCDPRELPDEEYSDLGLCDPFRRDMENMLVLLGLQPRSMPREFSEYLRDTSLDNCEQVDPSHVVGSEDSSIPEIPKRARAPRRMYKS